MTDSTILSRDRSPLCLSLAAEIDFNNVMKWSLIKLKERLIIAISSSQTHQSDFIVYTFVDHGMFTAAPTESADTESPCFCFSRFGFVLLIRLMWFYWDMLHFSFPPLSSGTQGNIIGFPPDKVAMPLRCCDFSNIHSEKPCSIGELSFPFLPSILYDVVAPSGDVNYLEFLGY